YIQDPIERMQLASSDQIFSYVNTGTAYIGGIEVEIKRNLGSLFNASAQSINNMTIGFNGSYSYNRIKVDSKKILAESGKPVAPTNVDRPLFGASPYLINFDYTYKAKWSQNSFTTFAVVYNVFGKRLFVAGSQGAGDIYEMPVNTLNGAINTTIGKRWNVDISVDNILNPYIKYNQEFADGDLEFARFRRGINAGLTIGYSF
ncbi:MAG TPA: TonB-dependent receptor, partial [Niabella sp.]|nr:TonB-dependent receptor [Niabella sp.]